MLCTVRPQSTEIPTIDLMKQSYSYFQRQQKSLLFGASLYVILLVLAHSTLPSIHVWLMAAVFSVAMNFTYVTEAYWGKAHFGIEFGIAATLIVASILGVLVSPVFVIAAIFAHGLWDISKHFGAGVPFLSWYTLSCFCVDVMYGGVLALYWWANY